MLPPTPLVTADTAYPGLRQCSTGTPNQAAVAHAEELQIAPASQLGEGFRTPGRAKKDPLPRRDQPSGSQPALLPPALRIDGPTYAAMLKTPTVKAREYVSAKSSPLVALPLPTNLDLNMTLSSGKQKKFWDPHTLGATTATPNHRPVEDIEYQEDVFLSTPLPHPHPSSLRPGQHLSQPPPPPGRAPTHTTSTCAYPHPIPPPATIPAYSLYPNLDTLQQIQTLMQQLHLLSAQQPAMPQRPPQAVSLLVPGQPSTSAAASAAAAAMQRPPLISPYINDQPSTSASAAPTAASYDPQQALTSLNIDKMRLDLHRDGHSEYTSNQMIRSYLESLDPSPALPPSKPKPLDPPRLQAPLDPSPPSSDPSDYTSDSGSSSGSESLPALLSSYHFPTEDVLMTDTPIAWELTYAPDEWIGSFTEGRPLPLNSKEARTHLDWARPELGGKMFLVYQAPGLACPLARNTLNGVDCVVVAEFMPGQNPRSPQHMALAIASTIVQKDGTLSDGLWRVAPPISRAPACAYDPAPVEPRPEQRLAFPADRAAAAASAPSPSTHPPRIPVLSRHYIKWVARGNTPESYKPHRTLPSTPTKRGREAIASQPPQFKQQRNQSTRPPRHPRHPPYQLHPQALQQAYQQPQQLAYQQHQQATAVPQQQP